MKKCKMEHGRLKPVKGSMNDNATAFGINRVKGESVCGFTLLEVMISLAIVGGLLVTLLYTLNYHLGIADRQRVVTVAVGLAKEKIHEMEKKPEESSGSFTGPNAGFFYTTTVRASFFPGMLEIGVVVRDKNEEIRLGELIRDVNEYRKIRS